MANRESKVEGAMHPAADPESSYTDEIVVTAVELARLARVAPSDVHYWGRRGYLHRKLDSPGYPLDQLRKAQLMAVLTKQLEMKASTASELADALVRACEHRPDALAATFAVVQALVTRTADFVSLILDLGVVPMIGQMLKKEKRKEPT